MKPLKLLLALFAFIFVLGNVSALFTLTFNAPVTGTYWNGSNQTVDFNFVDTNYNHNTFFDLNFYISADANTYTKKVQDYNLLQFCEWAGSYDVNISTTQRCRFSFVPDGNIGDGNWLFDLNITIWADSTKTNKALDASSAVGNIISISSSKFNKDSNNASLTVSYNAYWKNADQNLVVTCSDINSGCATFNYRVDTDTNVGVSMGTWQSVTGPSSTAWDFNYLRTADGNYAVDYNVADRAGNTTADARVYLLVDKTPPTISSGNWANPISDYNFNAAYLDVNGTASDVNSGIKAVSVTFDGNITFIGMTKTNIGSSDYNAHDANFNYRYAHNKPTAWDFNIVVRVSDWADNNYWTTYRYAHYDANKPSIFFDYNNSWHSGDLNFTLACNDTAGSVGTDINQVGCQRTINFRVDQNPANTVNWGAWQTYDRNVFFGTDGNWGIDFNASDWVGNVSDSNIWYVKIDKTNPSLNVDFNMDVNRTGISAGVDSTDLFIGRHQTLTVRVQRISSYTQNAPITDVNFSFRDVNRGVRGGAIWYGADENIWYSAGKLFEFYDANTVYVKDYNVGNLDANFSARYITARVKDAAGNWSTDINISNPIILFEMTYPPDPNIDQADSNTTNFRNLANFEDANIMFTISGKARVFIYDANIGTAAQGAQLVAFAQNVVGTRSTAGDLNIYVDTTKLTSFATTAKIAMRLLPWGSMPGIRKNDTNCGTNCTSIDYNALSGDLNFNITTFSFYITDINAPVFTSTTPSAQSGTGTISGTTNELSYCRYTATSGTDYNSMSNSTTTGPGTSHTWNLGAGPGTYTYYVRCMDLVGKIQASDNTISFTVESGGGGGDTGGGGGGGSGGGGAAAVAPGHVKTFEKGEPHRVTAEMIHTLLTTVGASPTAIEKATAAVGKTEISKQIVVDKNTDSKGKSTYTSTITISVSNNTSNTMSSVKIIIEVPKEIAQHASEINSAHRFVVLVDDPIIQYTVDELEAGQSTDFSYSVPKNVSEQQFEAVNPIVWDFQEIEPVVSAPGCEQISCDDYDECTTDYCTGGNCYHDAIPGCGAKPAAKPYVAPTEAAVDWTPWAGGIVIVIIVVGAAYYYYQKKGGKGK